MTRRVFLKWRKRREFVADRPALARLAKRLAREIHAAYRETHPDTAKPWDKLKQRSRAAYLDVAIALLAKYDVKPRKRASS